MRCRVGLLGASGHVGRELVGYLRSETNAQLSLAARRIPAQREESGRAVTWHAVDLYDEAALYAFCKGVDVVVNCAGPSAQVVDRVLRAALAADKPYLDPGGYEPLLARVGALSVEPSVPVLINAGLLPGLSGLYPKWIALGDSDPTGMEVFYAGTDAWSAASAWDIVHSLKDLGVGSNSALPGSQVRSRSGGRLLRRMRLPLPIGTVTGIRLRSPELEKLTTDLGIAELACHALNHGRWSGAVLAAIKLTRLYRAPEQHARAARWLELASVRDRRRGQPPCFAIDCKVRFANTRTHHACLLTGDTYRATALVLGIALRLVTAPDYRKVGPMLLQDAFEPASFLHMFRTAGGVTWETGHTLVQEAIA